MPSRFTKIERNTCNLVKVSNRKINKFRVFFNNTIEHECAKLKIYMMLRKEKHNLIVEAIFENGGRCDLLDLTTGTAIEVLHSETEKMLSQKKYPVRIIKIDSNKANKEILMSEGLI
jgi:hypothetical protein